MLEVNVQTCTGCKKCENICPFGAIIIVDKKAQVQENCTLCGACISSCPSNSLKIDRPTVSKEEIIHYKDVFVFAELDVADRRVKRVVLELLAKARELADKLQQKVVAVLLGHEANEIPSILISHGADKVITCQHELLGSYTTEGYTSVLAGVISQNKPSIFLFGATPNGRELAPRVAARLMLGLTADCTGLDIDDEQQLVQTRPAFGGNIMASIISPYTRPQMATVRPNTFKALNPDPNREIDTNNFTVNVQSRSLRTKIIEVEELIEDRDISLEEANIIVSVGRGITKKENISLAREFADELGGIWASSRALVDAGFVPHTRQVGQSGTTVTPKLYVAMGISGAVQHLVGMSSSDIIVAINNDSEAPIFKVADFSVVGDIFEVVPRLIKKIREYKDQGA
ncbi:MAG: FAD-binding protein [Candidatus Hodarchaeales archaeon]|jgi:electron transfer flavoprotein alpha subunit